MRKRASERKRKQRNRRIMKMTERTNELELRRVIRDKSREKKSERTILKRKSEREREKQRERARLNAG